MVFYFFLPLALAWKGIQNANTLKGTFAVDLVHGFCIVSASGIVIVFAIYLGRSAGKPLSPFLPFTKIRDANVRKGFLTFMVAMAAVLFFCGLPGVFVHLVVVSVFHRKMHLIWYLYSAAFIPSAVVVCAIIHRIVSDKRYRKRLTLMKANRAIETPLPLKAESLDELYFWIEERPSILGGPREIRSLLTLLNADKNLCPPQLKATPLFSSGWGSGSRRRAMQSLIEQLGQWSKS